jgi:hypothetical protein
MIEAPFSNLVKTSGGTMKPNQPLTAPSSPTEQPNSAMTACGLPLRYSKRRLALAFAIAAISDAVGAFVTLAPPAMWAVDIATVVLLFGVLGRQWLLLPGLVLEAIPGLGVLPFWLLVVGGIAVWGTARPKLRWLRRENGASPFFHDQNMN